MSDPMTSAKALRRRMSSWHLWSTSTALALASRSVRAQIRVQSIAAALCYHSRALPHSRSRLSLIGSSVHPQSTSSTQSAVFNSSSRNMSQSQHKEVGVAPPVDAKADTIFGKITRKEIPAKIAYEGQSACQPLNLVSKLIHISDVIKSDLIDPFVCLASDDLVGVFKCSPPYATCCGLRPIKIDVS